MRPKNLIMEPKKPPFNWAVWTCSEFAGGLDGIEVLFFCIKFCMITRVIFPPSCLISPLGTTTSSTYCTREAAVLRVVGALLLAIAGVAFWAKELT